MGSRSTHSCLRYRCVTMPKDAEGCMAEIRGAGQASSVAPSSAINFIFISVAIYMAAVILIVIAIAIAIAIFIFRHCRTHNSVLLTQEHRVVMKLTALP